MKVLWYEITIPSSYNEQGQPIAGWQDSLQNIVTQYDDIELYIVFEGKNNMRRKVIGKVTFIPLIPKMNIFEKKILRYWDQLLVESKLLPPFIDIVNELNPDVIHIFGTEWGLGTIANYTKIPVVIHMMGCVAPYLNALLPPNYSILNELKGSIFNLSTLYRFVRTMHYYKTWLSFEKKNFLSVSNYMGRTQWDKAMCQLFHTGCNYYYCSEALRPSFIENNISWNPPQNDALHLLTIGCSTHWKGIDTILKCANTLKNMGVNFVWNIAGKISVHLKRDIEKHEGLIFEECNVRFIGFVTANELVPLLLSTNLYIHTAYIDNSPNTICEAQYIGLPIISTNVGGIPSLIEDKKDGVLIPANDPFRLAYEINSLYNDVERQKLYSECSRIKSRARHNPQQIYKDLLKCYVSLIN